MRTARTAAWVFAPERLELRPGVTWLKRRVSHVTHRLTPKTLRTEVLFERNDETRARGRGALEALIDRRVAHTLFHGLYAATSVALIAGKLEVKLDDPRLPEITEIEIRHSAGLKVEGAVEGRRIGRRVRDVIRRSRSRLPGRRVEQRSLGPCFSPWPARPPAFLAS